MKATDQSDEVKQTPEDQPQGEDVPAKASKSDALKEQRRLMKQRGRVIIRNINFDLREKHIRNLCSPFGTIKEVQIPLKLENNLNRGFAFVEFETKQQANEAIKKLNGSQYKGRTIAVDLSKSKRDYEKKLEKIRPKGGEDDGDHDMKEQDDEYDPLSESSEGEEQRRLPEREQPRDAELPSWLGSKALLPTKSPSLDADAPRQTSLAHPSSAAPLSIIANLPRLP